MFKYISQYVNIDHNKLTDHLWIMLRNQSLKTDKEKELVLSIS